MTRERAIILALVVLLALAGWRWARAAQEVAELAAMGAAVDAALARETAALAEVARLKEVQRQADVAAREALKAVKAERSALPERVRVVRLREAQITAQPPSEAGALESLARAVAFEQARGLR